MTNLSNTDKTRLTNAMKQASLSTAKQKHGAVIYRGGSLISVGVNISRNDPYFIGEECINPNHHAETMAIRACSPSANLSNAILYVARINKKGFPLLSKPCKTCTIAIEQAGIKKVIYTEVEMKEWLSV